MAKQGAVAVGRDHQPRIGLGKTGQVIKIAVVAIGEVAVAVTGALSRGGDDGHTTCAQLGSQSGAALRVNINHEEIVGGV